MVTQKSIRFIRPNQPFIEWLKQLYSRRETLWLFVWKDLKVQYEKPILGLIWSVFQPLVYFGIILVIMQVSGREIASAELPFSVYLICGLAVWNFCTSGILGAINSMQSNSGIITKSSFPRFYLVLAPVLKSSIDLLIVLTICFTIAIYNGHPPILESFSFLPNLIFLVWITTLAWASIAASAVVWNRHFRHAIPILLYAMIFSLPVFYVANDIANPAIKLAYQLNPVAGAMDFLRACFSGTNPSNSQFLSWIIQSILWLTIGIFMFRRIEKNLADKV
jgi:ABC-type polysaccharide/polyol phosphate export permease